MANIKEHVQILVRDTTLLPGLESDFPFPAHAASHLLDGVDPIPLGLDDQNGFVDYTDVTEAFDNGTRTISLTPVGSSFSFWSDGLQFAKTAAVSIAISDVEGLHYIYFDSDGVIRETTTYTSDLITKYCFIAAIHWDATNSKQVYFARELRHANVMDGDTHLHEHDSEGYQLWYGGALGDFTIAAGSADADAQFSNEASGAYDEDAQFVFSQRLKTANLPVYYRTGVDSSDIWRIDEDDSFAVLPTGTGRAAWNELTGGSWQLTEVTNGKFVLAHIIITNDTDRPFAAIMGQNEYNNIVAARDGAESEVNSLVLAGLFTPEFYFLGTVIFQTSTSYSNTVKSRVVQYASGVDYVDLRGVLVGKTGTSIPATDHGALSGLGDDDHTQYLLADGTRNMTGGLTFTGTQTIATTSNGHLKLIPDGAGLVMVGTGTPGHLASQSGELYVQRKLEVDGILYTDAGIISAEGLTFTGATSTLVLESNTQTSGNVASIKATPGSASTANILQLEADGANWASGATVLSIISDDNDAIPISVTNGASEVFKVTRFGGFVCSGDITLTGGGGIYTNANGDLDLITNGTGVLMVGTGSPSYLTPTSGEMYVQGIAEFATNTYLVGTVTALSSLTMGAGQRFYSSLTSGMTIVLRNSSQSVNSGTICTGSNSRHVLICEYDDRAYDFAHALQTNPTVFIHSANQSTNEWISLSHDQTDGVLTAGTGLKLTTLANGDVNIVPNGTGVLMVGTGAPGHLTPTSGEMFVQGALEVDGELWIDGGFTSASACSFNANVRCDFGSAAIRYSAAQTVDSLAISPDTTSNSLLVCQTADVNYDFSHSAQTNPTVFIHSANQSTTEWISLSHDQTDGRIEVGTGILDFQAGSVTGSTVTHDAYWTVKINGVSKNIMLGS